MSCINGYLNSVTAHPGVGAIDNEYQSKDDVFSVKYYQWVCFTLFLQAIMFYLPKVTWKRFEGGRMARLIPPALIADPEHYDSRMPHFPKPKGLIPECDLEDCIRTMRTTLRLEKGKSRSVKGYFWKFLICEAAAFVNVIFQIFFTDVFLGGRFIDLGIGLWKEDNGAFPKVGKCTFRQFGPSGTVQTYDGICVLAVNIINAKIYVLFWFWLALLTSLSFLQLFYRVAMISCESVRKGQLRGKAHNLLRPRVIDRIVGETGISEFFLLNRIGANLNPWVFAALLEEIDRSLIAAGGYSLRNGIPHYNYPRNGQICHLGQMEKGEKTS